MKARVDNWIDIKKNKPMFGISVFVKRRWHRLAIDGKAFLTSSKKKAEKMVTKLAAA